MIFLTITQKSKLILKIPYLRKTINFAKCYNYDDRYIKTKIRRYGDKFCTNFRGLNVPEDDMECGSFTIISIGFFSWLPKQILAACIFRQLCLLNYRQANDRLSCWKTFWRLDLINALFWKSKEIGLTKSNKSKDCRICHNWFFNHGFKY